MKLTASAKASLLSRISTLEQLLKDVIKEQRAQAKRIMKLEHKARYEKKWLSMKEMIEYSGYTAGSLYQLNFNRKITTRKSGNGLQWKKESVDAYLEAREKLSVEELKASAA